MTRRRWMVGGFAVWLSLVVLGPWLAPTSYRIQDRDATLEAPTPGHRLGTDEFGRDEASRLLWASTLSSLLGLAMATPALGIAVGVGLGMAVWPATMDWGRAAGEVCRGLPWIFVLVAVRAALPLNAGAGSVAAALVILFAAAAWPVAAWTLYGAARQVMQQDYVQAARGLGASRWHLLRRHVWPNLRGLAATYFALLVAAAIGAEVSLELVGLGLPQPWPTFGNMLDSLRDYSLATHCWWLYSPLLILVPLLLGLSLAGMERN
ncbi:MAG TPA: ABC transporter permease subunit [Terriglobales bacterium]|nr:ABC transporter permease subunit [Terriglobales bacterium]